MRSIAFLTLLLCGSCDPQLHQAQAVLQEAHAAELIEHQRLQRELSDAGNVCDATCMEAKRIAQELVQVRVTGGVGMVCVHTVLRIR